jgi:hypothetical protein
MQMIEINSKPRKRTAVRDKNGAITDVIESLHEAPGMVQ